MGLILDTSVLIAAERRGMKAEEALASLESLAGDKEFALSVVTLLELAHGMERADNHGLQAQRRLFLDALQRAVPVYPLNNELAIRTGVLDGQLRSKGIRVGMADLIIGMTALQTGNGVATLNAKHFKAIPGLRVVEM